MSSGLALSLQLPSVLLPGFSCWGGVFLFGSCFVSLGEL